MLKLNSHPASKPTVILPIRIFAGVLVAMLAASTCQSVSAAIPLSGVVTEGESVPGIALGNTRADVAAAYGAPSFCQGPTQDFCTYTITGTGSVNVRFRGAAGGAAVGTADDVLYNVSWSGNNDWVTTAGISTALALSNPAAVTNAYPEGEVTYNFQGNIFRVNDPKLGVQVKWNYNLYAGTVDTAISITAAATPSAPALAIEPAANGAITLRWSVTPESYVLESTITGPPNDDWQPVVETPLVSAGENTLTLSTEAGTRFFRLRAQ